MEKKVDRPVKTMLNEINRMEEEELGRASSVEAERRRRGGGSSGLERGAEWTVSGGKGGVEKERATGRELRASSGANLHLSFSSFLLCFFPCPSPCLSVYVPCW